MVAALTAPTVHAQTPSFALKAGDRVVFYGDSITDQRMYTLFVEQYVVTRFPQLPIRFVHSGWGGDRVTGGGGGPIDTRLDRDVTAYKPSVVTVMLGMNDASYRAFDAGIFQTYSRGYQHLIEKIKKDNPGVRLTLIQPSPFDDITRPPTFDGGYNSVLKRYSAFVGELATGEGATVADLNTPVVAVLQRANTTNATVAQKIIPDRVHPLWGGHLIMAASLLKAWNAPALVSAVRLDAATGKSAAENARVGGFKTASGGVVSWTTWENALPFPIQPPDPNAADAFQLALQSSDFIEALDQERLTVTGLSAPRYALAIDAQAVGTFSKDELATGINLATLPTPMLKQAQLVASLTRQRANLHNARWREYQVPQSSDPQAASFLPALLKRLDAAGDELAQAQRAAAKPRPHTFTLTPQ